MRLNSWWKYENRVIKWWSAVVRPLVYWGGFWWVGCHVHKTDINFVSLLWTFCAISCTCMRKYSTSVEPSLQHFHLNLDHSWPKARWRKCDVKYRDITHQLIRALAHSLSFTAITIVINHKRACIKIVLLRRAPTNAHCRVVALIMRAVQMSPIAVPKVINEQMLSFANVKLNMKFRWDCD